eukprot:3270151-Heterocapsa_arctica.AAC.1
MCKYCVALAHNICFTYVEASGCYSEGVSGSHNVFIERVAAFARASFRLIKTEVVVYRAAVVVVYRDAIPSAICNLLMQGGPDKGCPINGPDKGCPT